MHTKNTLSHSLPLDALLRRETSDGRNQLFRQGGMVVTRNGCGQIGIALTATHAYHVLGMKIWDTQHTGIQISSLVDEISSISALSARYWRTITINQNAAFTFLSMACVKEHWNSLQINLPTNLIMGLAREMKMDVWPHIELESKKCKLIHSDWRHPTPYTQVDDIINNGNPEMLAKEIDLYGKPVILSLDMTTVKAHFLPLSMKGAFKSRSIKIAMVGVRHLREKEFNLDPDTIYVVQTHTTHLDHNPESLFMMAHPEPISVIKGIVENAHCFTPLEQEKDIHAGADRSYLVPSKTSPEAAMAIAAHFREAVQNNGVLGMTLETRQGTEQFIGAIANPKIVKLVTTVPLAPTPVNMARSVHGHQLNSKLFGLMRGDDGSLNIPASMWTPKDQEEAFKNLRALFHQITYGTHGKNCVEVLSSNDKETLGLLTGSRELYQAAQTLQSMTRLDIHHN